jgi:hypothetical protein
LHAAWLAEPVKGAWRTHPGPPNAALQAGMPPTFLFQDTLSVLLSLSRKSGATSWVAAAAVPAAAAAAAAASPATLRCSAYSLASRSAACLRSLSISTCGRAELQPFLQVATPTAVQLFAQAIRTSLHNAWQRRPEARAQRPTAGAGTRERVAERKRAGAAGGGERLAEEAAEAAHKKAGKAAVRRRCRGRKIKQVGPELPAAHLELGPGHILLAPLPLYLLLPPLQLIHHPAPLLVAHRGALHALRLGPAAVGKHLLLGPGLSCGRPLPDWQMKGTFSNWSHVVLDTLLAEIHTSAGSILARTTSIEHGQAHLRRSSSALRASASVRMA